MVAHDFELESGCNFKTAAAPSVLLCRPDCKSSTSLHVILQATCLDMGTAKNNSNFDKNVVCLFSPGKQNARRPFAEVAWLHFVGDVTI